MADDEQHASSKDYFWGKTEEDYPLWRRRQKVECRIGIAAGNTDAQEVARVFRLLRGGAANTAAAAMDEDAVALPWATPVALFQVLDAAYGATTAKTQSDAVEAMKVLRQTGDIDEYVQEFLRLKGLSGFSDAQAVPMMRTGLRKPVRGLLASAEYTTIADLVGAARRADKDAPTTEVRKPDRGGPGRTRGRGRGRRGKAAQTEKRREDMSAAEKREADKDIECFGCGKRGHRRADCRQKKGKKASRKQDQDEDPGWEDEALDDSGKE